MEIAIISSILGVLGTLSAASSKYLWNRFQKKKKFEKNLYKNIKNFHNNLISISSDIINSINDLLLEKSEDNKIKVIYWLSKFIYVTEYFNLLNESFENYMII